MPEHFHYHESLTGIMGQEPSGDLNSSAEMQINQNKFLLLGIFPAAWEEALLKKTRPTQPPFYRRSSKHN